MTDPYSNTNVASLKRNIMNATMGNPYVDTYIVDNGTISASDTGATHIFETLGSNTIELHILTTGSTGSPSLVVTITPYDIHASAPLSSSGVSGSAITGAGDQEIILSSMVGRVVGSHVRVSWVLGGSGTLTGCYIRLLSRR